MSNKIWLSPPYWSGREDKYIEQAVQENWIAPGGLHVKNLEYQLARHAQRKYCAVVNSGTSALHLSLLALGIGSGDFVFCPGFTFAAVINPVLYVGATPVMIDCTSDTWNLDPEVLEEGIEKFLGKNHSNKTNRNSARKKACLILVHNYGMPADVDRVKEIAEKYGIKLIEDAAEALGARYHQKPVGQFGDVSILSFNGNKIITASTGGALLSNDISLVEKAKKLANQSKSPDVPYYHFDEVGYNYQLSNLNAGVGLGQLETLEERVNKKRYIFDFYRLRLKDLPGISFQEEPDSARSSRWLTCMLVDASRTGGVSRENVYKALEKENIESRYVWKPLPVQPAFKDYPFFGTGVSEKLFDQGLCIPSGVGLTDEELERIVMVIRDCFG
jgi:dTDP-4-amino-4,6-dideoxygalactose transaminase